MKITIRILLAVGVLNFLVPLFALYLITARELVQEREWNSRIQRALSEAFEIGNTNPEMKKEIEEQMAITFDLIVSSRRFTVDILNAAMLISWGTSAALFAHIYYLCKNEKKTKEA